MVRVLLRILVVPLVALALASGAVAQRAKPEDAVALVKKGVEYVKRHGKVKAFIAFNDTNGPFVQGELYLFAYSINGDGIVLAHGQNRFMVGQNLIDMRDLDGVYINREFLKIANLPEGKGWLTYRWPNSVTKVVETKSSYLERVDDIWIACGIYK